MAAALAAEDVTLELEEDQNSQNVDLMADLASARQEEEEEEEEEEGEADSTSISAVNVDRPRSGKEARQRRAQRSECGA